jgi:N-acyl-D-amino-acid deacylase
MVKSFPLIIQNLLSSDLIKTTILFLALLFPLNSVFAEDCHDLILFNATIIDGSGSPSFNGDLAIKGEHISALGNLTEQCAKERKDVNGKVLAPGFINMLSWATESLIIDGRALSDIHQGVTLEVMGEGESMGPLNDSMKKDMVSRQDIVQQIPWTTLDEYLQFLEDKGAAVNVASFVGATTIRMHELGQTNRAPNADELKRMKALTRQAMEDGALGLGSSLIYAPAFYAKTEELIELAKVVGEYGGMYISHMRSEGNQIEAAVEELIRISKEGKLPAEIYHLKFGGKQNWHKFDKVIAMIDKARSEGHRITTDMYTYTAGATGLDAAMPPWVQEGGLESWINRLKDPAIRLKIITAMKEDSNDWENLYYSAGADKVILNEFRNPELRIHTGKTLSQLAKELGKSPEETAIDLVIEDNSRVGAIYFLMSEENVKRQMKLPYMSFGSDGPAPAPEAPFLSSNPHPRAYGNVARLLGKYVREEKVISLEEAVKKLTSLPASNLGIKNRGSLTVGYFADIVLFDPETIADKATFSKPHQLSVGVSDVWVNGKQALKDAKSTEVMAGKVVRGPGFVAKNN